MKSEILWLIIFPLVLLSALVSCDQEGYKGRYVLELDKDSVTIDAKGKEVRISVRANGDWKVENVPDWLFMYQEGRYSSEVSIRASENKELESREATILFTYGNGSKPVKVKQLGLNTLAPFIKLQRSFVQASSGDHEFTVELTANTPWHIEDVPQWISVTPLSGDKAAKLTIHVTENKKIRNRKAVLSILGKGAKAQLVIEQKGASGLLTSNLFPFISYTKQSYNGNYAQLWTKQLFITPGIWEKIYLGNLLNPNMVSNANISEYTGYTFNPITVSVEEPDGEEITKAYIPSRAEQDAWVKQIVPLITPAENSLRNYTSGQKFFERRWLAATGILSLGVRLDEVVYGSPFTQQEMTRDYGLTFSFCRILFNLKMDIPEKLVNEELKSADREAGVAYVASMKYGKIGLLVVEADGDEPQEMESVINKVLDDEVLTAAETDLLYSADIWYVYFNNEHQCCCVKGNLDVIEAYKKAMQDVKDNIYPIECQMFDYDSHSVCTFTFSVNM